MGGDHHHHHAPYKVPDYTIYKVEDVPKLVALQKRLAAKGLSDPWLRNEVWRFDKVWPTTGNNIRTLMTRGMLTGIVLCGITLGIEKLLEKDGDHHH